mmetsp:Transcript_481/g.599  ORF Transcript_481/g.599 Transcript_481/m.599 type:complete len:214 (-) Transcript_481:399-1040(-)
MNQLYRPLEAFQRTSGLSPDSSVGFGLAALLVAVSADCDGDMIGIGFRLLDTLPGFSLDTHQLNNEVNECYTHWQSLVDSLETCLEALENSHKEIINAMEQVKRVPDLMLLKAYREQWKIARFSEQSQIAEENAAKMDYAIEALGTLIQQVSQLSYQINFTVDQLSKQQCIATLNILGQEARDRSLTTPSVVQDAFKQQFQEYVANISSTSAR